MDWLMEDLDNEKIWAKILANASVLGLGRSDQFLTFIKILEFRNSFKVLMLINELFESWWITKLPLLDTPRKEISVDFIVSTNIKLESALSICGKVNKDST